MPTDLFTTASLGSYAGLIAATFLIVSFLKDPIKRLGDWYVRLLAVVVALGLQMFVQYVSGAITVEGAGLALLNAFMIALGSIGAYHVSAPNVTDPAAAPDAPRPPTIEISE